MRDDLEIIFNCLTAFPIVTFAVRDVGSEANVVEIHGMKRAQDRSRISVAGHIENQNVDWVFRASDLVFEPFRTNLHAVFRVCPIEEVGQIIPFNPLESSLKLALAEGINKCVINGTKEPATESIFW